MYAEHRGVEEKMPLQDRDEEFEHGESSGEDDEWEHMSFEQRIASIKQLLRPDISAADWSQQRLCDTSLDERLGCRTVNVWLLIGVFDFDRINAENPAEIL